MQITNVQRVECTLSTCSAVDRRDTRSRPAGVAAVETCRAPAVGGRLTVLGWRGATAVGAIVWLMVVVLSLSLLSGNRRARPLVAFLLRIVRVGLFFETLLSVILE